MSITDKLQFAYRCPLAWEKLLGIGTERHCESCQKTVTDLSSLTRGEATAFLAERKEAVCVRIEHDAAGRAVHRSPMLAVAGLASLSLVHCVPGVADSVDSGVDIDSADSVVESRAAAADGRSHVAGRAAPDHPNDGHPPAGSLEIGGDPGASAEKPVGGSVFPSPGDLGLRKLLPADEPEVILPNRVSMGMVGRLGPTPYEPVTAGDDRAASPGVSYAESPVILGALDRAQIEGVVKRNIASIRYCYQKELLMTSTLGGRLQEKFIIAKDGTVASATARSTMGNVAVESCVNNRFRKLQFPEPRGGGIVIVRYPFVFSPG